MTRKRHSLIWNQVISFYDILIYSNWGMLILVLFGMDNYTLYTNVLTKYLSIALCLIIHFVLLDSKKNKNPLLFMLGFELIFFYVFGIFAIGWSENSYYLDEAKVGVNDFNYTIFYIICATMVMWKAMHFIPKDYFHKADRQSSRKFSLMCVVVYVALLFSWLGHIPGLSYIQAFILIVFNVPGLLLFLYSYLARNTIILTKKVIFLIIIASLLLIIIKTMGGSRSGFLVVFMLLLSALLVENKVLIKMKYVIAGVLLLPMLVFIYNYSTELRRNGITFSDSKDKVEMLSVVADNMSGEELRTIVAPVVGRMAYISGACVSVKMKDGFSSFINPIYCFKSTIDNALTPGFDVFDTPRMSLCMRFFYNNQVNVKKSQLSQLSYESDVFTIFGEPFVMFGGWFGLAGIYLLCLYFKCLYIRFKERDNYLLMAATVYLFTIIFNSYGIDWFIFDVVSMMFSYIILKSFVNRRGSKSKLRNRQSVVVKS